MSISTNKSKQTNLKTLKKPNLTIVKELKKWKIKVSDQVITDFIARADKGEKKTEAGIKFWFEQTIPGHETEDGKESKGSPDGYAPGWLLLELKGKQSDWIEGLFEGLSRKELSFKLLVVACHKTLLVFPSKHFIPKTWSESKSKQWKQFIDQSHKASGSPSSIGKKFAKDFRSKGHVLLDYALFKWSPDSESFNSTHQKEHEAIKAFKNLVTSLDPENSRILITPKNFKNILESLLPFFNEELLEQFEVVHGFFRCMSYWNKKHYPVIPDSPVEKDKVYIGGGYFKSLKTEARAQFVEAIQRYEIENPNKALYYAHYDKAIDVVDPDYRANHGIYFTNEYLARLGISLAENYIGSIAEKYIVFDPACGSGNLVTSWNHHLDLRHKVVSEISPVLLQAFELRFQNKSTERKKGFTIIPKTSSGDGLNFVDISADDYLEKINSELKEKNEKLNKPLAIICNPPYRNQKNIKNEFYKYSVHPSLVDIAGKDASNELFVAFLAQISEICRLAEDHDLPPDSIVILFTKTVWLTGKSSYGKIKSHFLQNFKEKMGFVVPSSEFFDVKEKWPLMVTLWEYKGGNKLDENRKIKFDNLLALKKSELKFLCNDNEKDFDDLSKWSNDELFRKKLKKFLDKKRGLPITFNFEMKKLKDNIPPQAGDGNKQINLSMIEKHEFLGGLCFATEEQVAEREEKFEERVIPIYEHNKNLENSKANKKLKKKKIPSFVVNGDADGKNVGFTENKQPFRTNRPFKNDGKRLFFLMDTRFIKMKTSQCFSGVPPKRGHVVEGLDTSERNIIVGYAIAQSFAYKYPVQFDQFDMWVPEGDPEKLKELFELSCAFLLARNGCVECEVPANIPIKKTKRVFVSNPLSTQKDTFYYSHLRPVLTSSESALVDKAHKIVKNLYAAWAKWLSANPSYRAQADFPMYNAKENQIPSEGWGLYQIEKELSFIDDDKLIKLDSERRSVINEVSQRIREILNDEIDYWNV